jgi:DNA mismatch repair protein MLH1
MLVVWMHTHCELDQVDWTSEEECFGSFLRELAYFYVPGPSVAQLKAPTQHQDQDTIDSERWQIQHVLFPAMRKYFVAPKRLLERDVVQIANLPDLYRVFERC